MNSIRKKYKNKFLALLELFYSKYPDAYTFTNNQRILTKTVIDKFVHSFVTARELKQKSDILSV